MCLSTPFCCSSGWSTSCIDMPQRRPSPSTPAPEIRGMRLSAGPTMPEAENLPPTVVTLEHFRASLGPPLGLRRIRQRGRVIAAIGRWRHEGRRIELANVKATRLIFSLNGGQALQWRSGRDVASAIARCGSVSVAGHGIDATLEIHGRGDTLQILIEPVWLERTVSVEGESWSEAQKGPAAPSTLRTGAGSADRP